MATAKATTDHDKIRKWVEKRGGFPARVSATGSSSDPGVLRIDFPGYSGADSLERIEWDEFFEKFDESNLAALLGAGPRSRFNRLVDRGSAAPRKSSSRRVVKSSSRKTAAKKTGAKKSAAKKSSVKKSSAKKSSAKKSAAKKSGAKKTAAKKSAARKTSAGSKSRRR